VGKPCCAEGFWDVVGHGGRAAGLRRKGYGNVRHKRVRGVTNAWLEKVIMRGVGPGTLE